MCGKLIVLALSFATSTTGNAVLLGIVAVVACILNFLGVNFLENNYCLSICLPDRAKPLFKLHPSLILAAAAALTIYGLSMPVWTIVWLTVLACVSGFLFLDEVFGII